MKNFSAIHARTPKVYETHAHSWDTNRPRSLTERKWLDKFIAVIQSRSKILDVGCGGGEPIARYFIERDFSVTGVDIANAMIDIAQSRFPAMTWVQMDMRALDLGQKFDGIVSWDSFFHLSPQEQQLTLKHFFNHLKPGGAMLLTVGHMAGEVLGQVAGEEVYHSSLDPLEYKRIFFRAGFSEVEYVAQDQQCGSRSILLAHHQHFILFDARGELPHLKRIGSEQISILGNTHPHLPIHILPCYFTDNAPTDPLNLTKKPCTQ